MCFAALQQMSHGQDVEFDSAKRLFIGSVVTAATTATTYVEPDLLYT